MHDEGDRVRVMKTGSQFGDEGTVVDADFGGHVKIHMADGKVKSYLPSELGPAMPVYLGDPAPQVDKSSSSSSSSGGNVPNEHPCPHNILGQVKSLSKILMEMTDSLPQDDKVEAMKPVRAWLAKPSTTCKSPTSNTPPAVIHAPKVQKEVRVEETTAVRTHPSVARRVMNRAELRAIRYMFQLCDQNAKSRVETKQAISFLRACISSGVAPDATIRKLNLSDTLSFYEFHQLVMNLSGPEVGGGKKKMLNRLLTRSPTAANLRCRKDSNDVHKLASLLFVKNASQRGTTGKVSPSFPERRVSFYRQPQRRASFLGDKIASRNFADESGAETEDQHDDTLAQDANAIHPNSATAYRIILVTTMLVVYSSFSVSYRLGFDPEEVNVSLFARALDFVTEIWFMGDMYCTSRMGYIDSKTRILVMNLSKIRMHYLRSWFVVDFLSSIPLRLLELAFDGSGKLTALKLIRLFKLFRLVKVLTSVGESFEDFVFLRPSHLRLIKVIFVAYFVIHISSCFYWGMVRATCVVCDEISSQHYTSTCFSEGNPLNTGPSFTTASFCPPVSAPNSKLSICSNAFYLVFRVCTPQQGLEG
jgi:hypothetical protein